MMSNKEMSLLLILNKMLKENNKQSQKYQKESKPTNLMKLKLIHQNMLLKKNKKSSKNPQLGLLRLIKSKIY